MNVVKSLRKVLADQRGAGLLVLALAGMMVGSLVVAPVLGRAGTVSKGVTQMGAPRSYEVRDAGIEHAVWRLLYESNFATSLTPSNPTTQYSLTLSGVPVTITVTTLQMNPVGAELKVLKNVTPTWDLYGVAHTFVYTITMVNQKSSAVNLNRVQDSLPSGIDYVPGSTIGVITSDPTINGKNLRWQISPPVSIPAYGSATLTFSASAPATASIGTYWNSADARFGSTTISTGNTAQVRIINTGNLVASLTVSPSTVTSNTLTTYTYTVTVTNYDATSHQLKDMEFWVEAGFTYVTGSTGQDCAGVTTSNPTINAGSGIFDKRYKWTFGSYPDIPALGSVVHCFRASATLSSGIYYHMAEAEIADLDPQVNQINTGTTAPISVLSAFRIDAVAKGRTSSAIVHIVGTSTTIYSWQVQ